VGAGGQRFERVNVPRGADQLVTGLDQNNLAAYTKAAIVKADQILRYPFPARYRPAERA
jgi:hypothetical protein